MKISIGALEDLSFDATLEYVSPKAVENNGTNQFEIKAAVTVPSDQVVRSGYSANAEIVLQSVSQVPSVEESALVFEDDDIFVYKVTPSGYEKTKVEIGLSDGVNVEIKSGLKVGDKVRGTRIIE